MSSYIKIVYILFLVTFLSIWCYLWAFSQIRTFLQNYFDGYIYGNLGFPGGSDGTESTCNVGDVGLIPGWEDPLEEGMAAHSSIIAWRIPMDREEPGGLQSVRSQKVGHDWATKHSKHTKFILLSLWILVGITHFIKYTILYSQQVI